MDTAERRWNERRPAADNKACMLWEEGADCLKTPVRLLDISRGGARFVAEHSPPEGRDVCLRLEAPKRSGWVLARIVRAVGATEGGLSFSGYLSHDLIAGLV